MPLYSWVHVTATTRNTLKTVSLPDGVIDTLRADAAEHWVTLV